MKILLALFVLILLPNFSYSYPECLIQIHTRDEISDRVLETESFWTTKLEVKNPTPNHTKKWMGSETSDPRGKHFQKVYEIEIWEHKNSDNTISMHAYDLVTNHHLKKIKECKFNTSVSSTWSGWNGFTHLAYPVDRCNEEIHFWCFDTKSPFCGDKTHCRNKHSEFEKKYPIISEKVYKN